LVRAQGPEAEASLLVQLTAEEQKQYQQVVATDWIPIEFITRLFEAAAPVVYPGKQQGLRLIGRDLAIDNLRGVYRYVARILTVPFLLEQGATFWRTYHRHGTGHVERLEPKHVQFVVEGYPRLPERFRECMCGWIIGAVEVCGGKSAIVKQEGDDPEAWRWDVRWR
jgi:hypothetical protein